jgi:tetratricopeptide (TPR) repeat protein
MTTVHPFLRFACLSLMAALPAAAAGVIGCSRPLPAPAAQDLREALAAYQQGDDSAVIDRTGRVISDFASSPETAEAHYLRALARIRQEDGAGGEQDLQRALALTRRDDLAAKSHLALGLLADSRGNEAAAKEQYTTAAELFDRVGVCCDAQEEALCRLGIALQKQGEFLEADRYFDRLLHLYGEGRRSAAARQRIRAQGWTLLAAGFASLDDARRLRDELEGAGRDAQVVAVHCGNVSFQVRVGKYKTYKLAEEAREQLGDEMPGAQIVVER